MSDVAILLSEAELEALIDRRIEARELAAKNNNDSETLSLNQVAALIGCHRKTVPNLIRNRGLPYVPIGNRKNKFLRSAVVDWMAERKRAKEL